MTYNIICPEKDISARLIISFIPQLKSHLATIQRNSESPIYLNIGNSINISEPLKKVDTTKLPDWFEPTICEIILTNTENE